MNTNKYIFCGDCVCYCAEIQGIGAIDFAYSGEKVRGTPASGADHTVIEETNEFLKKRGTAENFLFLDHAFRPGLNLQGSFIQDTLFL